MIGWKHTEEIRSLSADGRYVMACWEDQWPEQDTNTCCGCTTPTPDPASPCAVLGCEHDANATWTHGPSGHPHQPTRCTCGHAIEAINPGPAASGSEGGTDHG